MTPSFYERGKPFDVSRYPPGMLAVLDAADPDDEA